MLRPSHWPPGVLVRTTWLHSRPDGDWGPLQASFETGTKTGPFIKVSITPTVSSKVRAGKEHQGNLVVIHNFKSVSSFDSWYLPPGSPTLDSLVLYSKSQRIRSTDLYETEVGRPDADALDKVRSPRC